jgi:hypothetical protein
MKYLAQSGIENFLDNESGEAGANMVAQQFIDTLRLRIDSVKEADSQFKEYYKKEKKTRRRRAVKADSDLGDFIVE